jgi:ubiquinone/menaquinone biosynthesis C-methylase UbiE
MKDLQEDQKRLESKIKKLENKVAKLDVEFKQEPIKLGVDLFFMQHLYCPSCQKPLRLNQADIQENMIMEGEIGCNCDFNLEVKNGIIIDRESMKNSEETDETYFIKYVDETNKGFLTNIYTAMEWSHRNISFQTDQAMVLELGVGNGILLSHIYNDLPDHITYIAVDYDYYKLRYLKKVFERSGIKKNIVFLCSDYQRMPLKHRSIDYVVDFFGMSNYSFRNSTVLHRQVESYYKEHCHLIGLYMLFDKFRSNSEISTDQYHLFKKDNILKYLDELDFKQKDEYLIGYSEEGEKNDVLFEVTNRVYVYGYIGERK